MKYLFIVLIICCFGCSGGGGGEAVNPIFTAKDRTIELIGETSGVKILIPEEDFVNPVVQGAITEVDASVRVFARTYGLYLVKQVSLHHARDQIEFARYTGNGTIEACAHEATPRTFCLSEAIGDLYRAEAPHAGINDELVEYCEQVVNSMLQHAYELEQPIFD